jgi:hypothetical protein
VERTPDPTNIEAALHAELHSEPSPAAATAIDRRVTIALASDVFGVGQRAGFLRRMTVAPVVAVVLALALGTVMVTAALVLTADDQRVFDLTACMRAQGWDVADPNVENGADHVVPGFSTIVDEAQQEAFNADLEACATDVGIPMER